MTSGRAKALKGFPVGALRLWLSRPATILNCYATQGAGLSRQVLMFDAVNCLKILRRIRGRLLIGSLEKRASAPRGNAFAIE
jgi:hypothetical protein